MHQRKPGHLTDHLHAAHAAGDSVASEEWLRIVAVMERLAASRDLKEILSLIVDSMRDLLHADRASVLEYDAEKHELFATTAHGVDASLRFSAESGLAGEAVRTKRIINVPDCYADARFNRDIDARTGYRTRCMLTVPLVSLDGRIEGVAQVLNKREDLSADYADYADSEGRVGVGAPGVGGVPPAPTIPSSPSPHQPDPTPSNPPSSAIPAPLRENSPPSSSPNLRNLRNLRITPSRFDARDEMIARALASQAAVAIRRARLIEAEKRKEKMEADLRIAREIQVASLPRALPSIAGWDLAAATAPAEETGGDAYDVIVLDGEEEARGRIVIVMADAAGHGVGPALSVAQAVAMVRMAAVSGASLGEIVSRANRLLHESLPVGRFVAAVIGVLDVASGTFEYVAAGIAPVMVLRRDGRLDERGANAPPLGIDREIEVDRAPPITLAPGEALVLLSDGYVERMNARAKQWGAEALREVLGRHRDETAAGLLAALDEAAAAHGNGRRPEDDQTAVIVRRKC